MTFEQFVAARLPALLRQATVLAGDPHLAEDVVQDVLLKAQAKWSWIVAVDGQDAYLRRMIINELVSTRRRVFARLRRERTQFADRVDDRSEQLAQRDALVRGIKALPARQRIVIALRYFEDLPDTEIAALLGCGVGTVRSHASRGLARLRDVTVLEQSMEMK